MDDNLYIAVYDFMDSLMDDNLYIAGYGFFAVWAAFLSYWHWQSPFWAALDGMFGVFYLLFTLIAY